MTYQAPISPDPASLRQWGATLQQQLLRTRAEDVAAREALKDEIAAAKAAVEGLRAELADFGDTLQLLGGEDLDDDDLGLIGGIEAFRRKLKREVAAVFTALRVDLDETLDWAAASAEELIGEVPPLLDLRALLERMQIETGENVARLTAEINTRINDDEAIVRSVQTVQAELDDAIGVIHTALEITIDEQGVRVGALDTLYGALDDAVGLIHEALEITVVEGPPRVVTVGRLNTIETRIGNPPAGQNPIVHARITTRDQLRADEIQAVSTRVDVFEAAMQRQPPRNPPIVDVASINQYMFTRIRHESRVPTRTDPLGGAFAQSGIYQSLTAKLGDHGAVIDELKDVKFGENGASSRWAIVTSQIDNNRRAMTGMVSLTDSSRNGSRFTVVADEFGFWMPPQRTGGVLQEPEFIFGFFNRNGVRKLALKGDLIADGSIKADRIEVASLKARVGEFLRITADVLSSQNGAMKIDLANGRIVGQVPDED